MPEMGWQAGSVEEGCACWGPRKGKGSLQGGRGLPELPDLATRISSEETTGPFRLSFCICPCTYIYQGDPSFCLSPVPVCPYDCHLAGVQLAWAALPSTDRQPVTLVSGRTWGTCGKAEARGRQPMGGATLPSAVSGCQENWLSPEPHDT